MMKPSKIALPLLMSLVLTSMLSIQAASLTQTKPDFSGIWKLDMSATDFGGPKSDLAYDELTLVIAHHDPELKITRKTIKKKRERLQELVYFTDERGESNAAWEGKAAVKTKTKWDGNTLRSDGSSRGVLPEGAYTDRWTDKWELSSDGNTLIHTTVSKLIPDGSSPFPVTNRGMILPGGPSVIRRVFRRVP